METRPLDLSILTDALLEVSAQLCLLVISWLDWVFTEHLLIGNIVSAALLLGLADFSIQTLELFLFKTRARYDSARNYRSMQVGLVLGVFNHVWYAFLETQLHGPGLPTVLQKIALDQAVAGPFFSSAFLVGMGLLEGKSTTEVYEEWSQKFIHIYMVDWMFWPLAQFINFYLVPYRFRVFYVNFATFLWNTFLSYAKHSSEEVIRKHYNGSQVEERESSADTNFLEPGAGTKKSNSKSVTKRKSTRSRGKAGGRVRKPSRPKHGSFMSASRCCLASSSHHWPKSSSGGDKVSLNTGEPKPCVDRTSVIKSIISVKKMVPMLKLNASDVASKTSLSISRQTSWVTAACATSAASVHSCSTSGSSLNCAGSCKRNNSTTESSAATASAIAGQYADAAAQQINMPNIKKLRTFDKTSCLSSLPARQQPQAVTRLSLRAVPAARRKPPARLGSAGPAGDIAKRPWMAKAGGSVGSTLRAHPVRPVRPAVQAGFEELREVRELLHELRDLIATGQREVREALAESQEQVSRLQELCAVTYVCVDDGTRELAHKADQLARWVQEDGRVTATMEEMLAPNQA